MHPAHLVCVSATRGHVRGDPVSRLPARCSRLNLSLLAWGKSQARCVFSFPAEAVLASLFFYKVLEIKSRPEERTKT